jgi:hypothetical protein
MLLTVNASNPSHTHIYKTLRCVMFSFVNVSSRDNIRDGAFAVSDPISSFCVSGQEQPALQVVKSMTPPKTAEHTSETF